MPPRTVTLTKHNDICCICLNTEKSLKRIKPELEDFYDDISDYSLENLSSPYFCEECIKTLGSFYLFKRKCEEAIDLLRKWDISDHQIRQPMRNLHKILVNSNSENEVGESYCNPPSDKNKKYTNKSPPFSTNKHTSTTANKQNSKTNTIPDITGIDIKNETEPEMCMKYETLYLRHEVLIKDEHFNELIVIKSDIDELGVKASEGGSNLELDMNVVDTKDSNLELVDKVNCKDSFGISNREGGSDVDLRMSKVKCGDSNFDLVNKENCRKSNVGTHSVNKGSKCKRGSNLDLKGGNKHKEGNDRDIVKITENVRDNGNICNLDVDISKQEEFKNGIDEGDSNRGVDDDGDSIDEDFNMNKEGATVKNGRIRKDLNKVQRPKKIVSFEKYKAVFDIVLYNNEAERRAGFDKRQHTDYYRNAKFSCGVCFTVHQSRTHLNHHLKWHEPSAGDFACSICAMRYSNKRNLRKHINACHFGEFACKQCPLIVFYRGTMLNHFEKHAGFKHQCKICYKMFGHKSTLMNHRREVHARRHACAQCARAFISDRGLQLHQGKMHPEPAVLDPALSARCDDCDLTFINKDILNVHLSNIHKEKDKANVLCSECGKEFAGELALRAHSRVHKPVNTTNKRIIKTCSICGVKAWTLHQHWRREHPNIPYESKSKGCLCHECGRRFMSLPLLLEHVNAQAGARPHACARCPARFGAAARLRAHAERHAAPARPCPHCGNKFLSAANLYSHMKTHGGEKRYTCSLCPARFLHAGSLREHVRGVHLHQRRTRRRNADKYDVGLTRNNHDKNI